MTNFPLHAVILAGGAGTRFWPLSRETWPKQMLQIFGEDTLLRQSIKRASGLVPPENIWIVTTETQLQDIRFHLEPFGPIAKSIRFIVEPVGRNTAPAIGLAAIHLNQVSADSVMLVMPSDHAIPNIEEFVNNVGVAVKGAEKDYLVTFGIKPHHPETGYGYIKADTATKVAIEGLVKVDGFVEKPNLDKARAYLAGGNYFWNSGICVWKTSKILLEIKKHLPRLYNVLKEIEGSMLSEVSEVSKVSKVSKESGSSLLNSFNSLTLRNSLYSSLENISIDYGVMERSRDVLMAPATFQWSDLGSWTALDEVLERDEAGNIIRGNTINIGSRESIVFSGERVVATIGLKDMVVVDTPDATLVSPKEKVQEVRKVVEELKRNHREEHLLHKTVERPWGSYTVLEKGPGYKIKRIVLKPQARLSLQLHRKRSEHWVVVEGRAKVTREAETFLVHTNESTYIPVNAKHRLENPEQGFLRIIEVQNGEYVEEDDIERFEDDYGRSPKERH
jgi:mannose-1-phosphate guanylyltransferase/mannose-6-phosphate isomerase